MLGNMVPTQTSFFMQKQILISVDSSGLNCVYTSVCVFLCLCEYRGSQKAEEGIRSPGAAVTGHQTWMLGTDLDSLHEQSVPSCGAISPH